MVDLENSDDTMMEHRTCVLAVMALVIMFETSGIQGNTGVYFQKMKTVHMSYSSWILTFSIDLHQYDTFFTNLDRQVAIFHRMMSRQPINTNSSWTAVHSRINSLFKAEDLQFNLEFDKLRSLFTDITNVLTSPSEGWEERSRKKRSLIPLGKAFSFLFGVANDEELTMVKQAVLELKTSQRRLIHIISGGLSIINATHRAIENNRHFMGQLADATMLLKRDLNTMYETITSDITPEIMFTHVTTQISTMYHIIFASFISLHHSLVELESQLAQLLQGKLPLTLVLPNTLKKALMEIQAHAPAYLELPYALDRIDLYYLLDVSLFHGNGQIHVAMDIPLVHKISRFTIYKVISMPIAHSKIGMSISYQLDHDFVAISKDKSRYMLLSQLDIEQCTGISTPYCQLEYPSLDINAAATCLTSLYFRNEALINDTCVITVSRKRSFPVIHGLGKGKWLISCHKEMGLEVTCPPSNVTDLRLLSGINEIQIPTQCQAYSRYFTLPQSLGSTIEIDIEPVILTTFNLTKLMETFSVNNLNGHKSELPSAGISFKMPTRDTVNDRIGKLQDELTYGFSTWDEDHLKVKKSHMALLLGALGCFGFIVLIILLICAIRRRSQLLITVRHYLNKRKNDNVNETTNPPRATQSFDTTFVKLSPLR